MEEFLVLSSTEDEEEEEEEEEEEVGEKDVTLRKASGVTKVR